MKPQGNASLAGTLADFGLVDIIQLIDLGKKTGQVRIRGQRRGRQVHGYIFFCDGKIHHAQAGDSLGDEAAYLLFGVTEGVFEFVVCTTPPHRNVFLSNEFVIMEGIARQDDAADVETTAKP